MPPSVELQAKRAPLIESVVRLAAVDLGVDMSEPMSPNLRSVIWNEAMAAYHAWCDLIEIDAQVEATSQFEKALVELCHLDRAIRRAAQLETQSQQLARGNAEGARMSSRQLRIVSATPSH